MINAPQFLLDIKANLKQGTNQRRAGQTILAEYGYQRRRQSFVDAVNADLEKVGLITDPSITTKMELWTPQIRFRLADDANLVAVTTPSPSPTVGPSQPADLGAEDTEPTIPPPTEFRLADLAAAENMPECVRPEQLASEAFTSMQCNDYSQLVVVDGHGKFVGLVSLRSILEAKARLAHKDSSQQLRVSECLDERGVTPCPPEMRLEDAISALRRCNCLVITASDKRVRGIVTPFDLANEFATIVAPFKRIEEIETRLKIKIEAGFTHAELGVALANSDTKASEKTAAKLSFGEAVRLVQDPAHWKKLKFSPDYDRKAIAIQLDWVRGIRNDLMHFREVTSDTSRLNNVCDVVRNLCHSPK